MSMITEAHLEDLTLAWFQDAGWKFVDGDTIAPNGAAPEREEWRESLLRYRMLSTLAQINPELPAETLETVVHHVENLSDPTLIGRNHRFHQLLVNGVSVEVERDGEKQRDNAVLIEFANPRKNEFLVVNQLTVEGTHQKRRPDIVCFVNGMPLAVLELKNPLDEHADIWRAYQQLQTYKEEIPQVMNTNEVLVVSDGIMTRFGSLTSERERFLPWRVVENEDDQPLVNFPLETLVRGLFDPTRFLDYVRNFILFEQDSDRLIKKIAGYHQFHSVNAAIDSTLTAAQPSEPALADVVKEPRTSYERNVIPGSKKAGVVWHTQGSGKSITMVCYAAKLLQQPQMKNPTVVVVTDRQDLDNQLFGTFAGARELLREIPLQADSRDDLRTKLAERESGGILFTTIQKFALLNGETKHPTLSQRENIVVISDEAHRSQYGNRGRFDQKTGKIVFGYSRHLRDALPNATFIGFTGTPIQKEDRDTRAVFGDYVSIYDIQDAVKDGATVAIYYESRLAKIAINRKEIDALSGKAEEVIEDEEDVVARENALGIWSQLAALAGTKPRLKQVAADLIAHFKTRTAAMPGKGMIVAMSRNICVDLYNEIVDQCPDWHNPDPEKGKIKIIMTGSAADKDHLRPHLYSSQTKKRLEKRFKDPADPLELVIVRDMWLTGFDAPSCHTMYVDKPMEGHNLMQAIARVNRVFRGKEGGLVVDYIGIALKLREALKVYVDANGKGEPATDTSQAYALLVNKLDTVLGIFHNFDLSDLETDGRERLIDAMDFLVAPPSKKDRFLEAMLPLKKAYALCAAMDEVQELHIKIAFFDAISTMLMKRTVVDKKRIEEAKHSLLKQILDNAIVAEGVDDIFALAGLKKPNIGLLAPEFLIEVQTRVKPNLAVELLQRLMWDTLATRTQTNVVQEQKFSERLRKAIARYHNRAIETAQVIEELIAMAKDYQATLVRDEELGLKPEEIAFYDALANNESAVDVLGDEKLKLLAIEITEKLRNSTTVDWQVRESVRAKIRILVKRTLKRWGYPPKFEEDAVNLVLKQAEAMANDLSS